MEEEEKGPVLELTEEEIRQLQETKEEEEEIIQETHKEDLSRLFSTYKAKITLIRAVESNYGEKLVAAGVLRDGLTNKLNWNEIEVNKVFEKLDMDGDGNIVIEDFLKL